MKHHWTECDDIVALYLCRFGPSIIGRSIEAIAETLGISYSSIQNFQSLVGKKGLTHVAEQSRNVFARFGGLSEPELRAKAIRCLNNEVPTNDKVGQE